MCKTGRPSVYLGYSFFLECLFSCLVVIILAAQALPESPKAKGHSQVLGVATLVLSEEDSLVSQSE